MLAVASAHAFTVWGPKWPNASATYKMESSYTSQGSGWADSGTAAVASWNSITNAPFWFGSDPGSINSFTAGSSQPCSNIAGTFRNNSGNNATQFTVEVNINCGFGFYDGTNAPSLPPNWYDLRSVMRHELGHALGLNHSCTSGLLMYGGMSPGVVYNIDQDAINGDRYLYDPTYSGPGPEGAC
jgi:hypothetical protein